MCAGTAPRSRATNLDMVLSLDLGAPPVCQRD
jgi:hypothetical protein